MKKVAIIGGSGMVASRFIDLAKGNFDFSSLDEKSLDITNADAVSTYFSENKFDTVLNFAAYTNVDGAQKEIGQEDGIAYRLNVLGPRNLAMACNESNSFLIHISTDFVFPGSDEMPGPYDEESLLPQTPDGIGWYGWTKNRAEFMLQNTSNSYAVVRYGYPFRADNFEPKLDWARNLINLFNEQKLYPLFTDQTQSIILIDDLVEPLVKIIDNSLTGIFHIASSDTTTPYEIGKYLLEKYSGKEVEIKKGSMEEFLKVPGKTPRPRLGGLNSLKTQKALNLRFKTCYQMVDDFVSQLNLNP